MSGTCGTPHTEMRADVTMYMLGGMSSSRLGMRMCLASPFLAPPPCRHSSVHERALFACPPLPQRLGHRLWRHRLPKASRVRALRSASSSPGAPTTGSAVCGRSACRE